MRALLPIFLAGCVSSTLVIKGSGNVSLPLLGATTAADMVGITVVAVEGEGFTLPAALGTALAITAVDVVLGCLFGACTSLKL